MTGNLSLKKLTSFSVELSGTLMHVQQIHQRQAAFLVMFLRPSQDGEILK